MNLDKIPWFFSSRIPSFFLFPFPPRPFGLVLFLLEHWFQSLFHFALFFLFPLLVTSCD